MDRHGINCLCMPIYLGQVVACLIENFTAGVFVHFPFDLKMNWKGFE